MGPGAMLRCMKDKSHKGQRHKGCFWCNPYKQLGNAEERRPARDRRQLERATDEAASPSPSGTH